MMIMMNHVDDVSLNNNNKKLAKPAKHPHRKQSIRFSDMNILGFCWNIPLFGFLPKNHHRIIIAQTAIMAVFFFFFWIQ